MRIETLHTYDSNTFTIDVKNHFLWYTFCRANIPHRDLVNNYIPSFFPAGMTDPQSHLGLANPQIRVQYTADTHIHLCITYIYMSDRAITFWRKVETISC